MTLIEKASSNPRFHTRPRSLTSTQTPGSAPSPSRMLCRARGGTLTRQGGVRGGGGETPERQTRGQGRPAHPTSGPSSLLSNSTLTLRGCVLSRSAVSHSLRPHALLGPWESPGAATPSSRGSSGPGSHTLQADSLLSEPPGTPSVKQATVCT